jgi:hypothetical protein
VKQSPVDDPHRTDGNDFITGTGIQPGRFCIEDGIGKIQQRTVIEFRFLPGLIEQIEIEKFRSTFLKNRQLPQ